MDYRSIIISAGLLLISSYFGQAQTIECPSTNDEIGTIYNSGSVVPINHPLSEKESVKVKKFNDLITIPVVVHNVYYRPDNYRGRDENLEGYLPDSVIKEQLQILNDDFSGKNPNRVNITSYTDFLKSTGNDSRIRFDLVETRRVPTSVPQFDFIDNEYNYSGPKLNIKLKKDGGSTYVNNKFNIWVGKIAKPEATVPGYSSFPKWPVAYDGVVINFTCFGSAKCNELANIPEKNGGQTLTHETGHYLGLYHTFGTQCNRISDNCCGSDDYVFDTPRHKIISFNCQEDAKYNCDNEPVMFMNFMNYNKDDCLSTFSNGQIERMRLQLMPGYHRHNLYLNRLISETDSSTNVNFLPLIEDFQQAYGKVWLNLTPKEQLDDLLGYVLRVKDLTSNDEKSVFIAYDNIDLTALSKSPDLNPLLERSIKVNSASGLTGTKIDGLKPQNRYLFEVHTVLANNLLGDKVQYFYTMKRAGNPSNSGKKIEIVVPK